MHSIPRLLLTITSGLPLAAIAQSAPGGDPHLVITRTVEPRVAYRALSQRTDNPILAQAPVFPAAAFGRAMNGLVAENVGDDVLGALGAGGLDGSNGPRTPGLIPAGVGLGPAAQGTAPTGLSGPTGAVGRATSDIGDIVTSTLSQALGNIGGGP